MKHTNLDNEIDGTYTKLDWLVDTLITVAIAGAVIVLVIELSGLADYLLGSLMG